MAEETLSPDAILEQSGWSAEPTVAEIDEDVDTPAGDWIEAENNEAEPLIRTSFSTPSGPPEGNQSFRVWVRRHEGTGEPTVRLQLYENGTLVSEGEAVPITEPEGQMMTYVWPASSLGTEDGSLVELRVETKKTGGPQADRSSVDLDAINWDAVVSAGTSVTLGVVTQTITAKPLSVVSGAYFRGSSSASSESGTLELTRPAATEPGDLLVATVLSSTTEGTPPEGWTEIAEAAIKIESGAGGTLGFMRSYQKVADSEDPASWSWTGVGEQSAGGMLALIGVQVSSTAGVNSGTENVLEIKAPSLTSSGPAILLCSAGTANEALWEHPTGMIEEYDESTFPGLAEGVGISLAREDVGSGETGERTFVNEDPEGHGGENSAAFSILLEEEAAATSVTLGVVTLTTTPKRLTTSTYEAEVLSDEPLGYWRLGESEGTTAKDIAGNENDGTYRKEPTLGVEGALEGDSDTAVAFGGTEEDIQVPDDVTIQSGDVFTLEAWVKRNALNERNTLIDGGTTGTYSLQFYEDNLLVLRLGGGSDLARSTIEVADEVYHHIVSTKSGEDIHIYIDGEDVTENLTKEEAQTNEGVSIASGAGEFFFANVTLDEVAVYDTALSEARVKAHYEAGTAGPIEVTLGVVVLAAQAQALSITHPITNTLGVVTTTAQVQPLSVTKPIDKTLGVTALTTQAQALSVSKPVGKTLGVVTTIVQPQALSVTKPKQKTLGVVLLTAQAQALSISKLIDRTLGIVTTATQAQALSVVKPIEKTLGVVATASQAQPLSVSQPTDRTLGVVTTATQAQALTVSKPIGKTLGVVTAAVQPQFLSVTKPVLVDLGVVSLAIAARALSLNQPIQKTLGVAALTTQAQSLSVTGGAGLVKVKVGGEVVGAKRWIKVGGELQEA